MTEETIFTHIIAKLDKMDRKLSEVDERTKRIEATQADQALPTKEDQLRRMLGGGRA